MATLVKQTAATSGYPSSVPVFTFAASVPAGDDVVLTGHDILIVYNIGVVPRTFTITSQADPYGRTMHITAQSLAAGAWAIFGPIPITGWADANGKLNLASEHADIKYAVLTLWR